MNVRGILFILGQLLLVLAAAELVPLFVTVPAGENAGTTGLLVGAATTAGAGLLFRRFGHADAELFRRDGVLIVVSSWLLASIAGAIPYLVSGAIAGPVDALFESASGFTTTGASILPDIEALGSGILFWRSLTQWLGGIGIIVLFVALLAEFGPGARFLFQLEVPGPRSEVLHPRVRETALALARIYGALSLALVLALLLSGLSLYDALTHTFATVSTGGFSPYTDSLGHFGRGVQVVVLIFMVLASLNFTLYFAALRDRSRHPLRDAELRTYLMLLGVASIAIFIDRFDAARIPTDLLDTAFQVVSIASTTGFATADFAHWPALAEACLIGLMVAGGCAGSTAGGAKVIRLMIGWNALSRDVRLLFAPNHVIAVTAGGKAIPNDAARAVLSFGIAFAICWGLGTVLLTIGEHSLETAASAAIAALSNVGPGLGEVGPNGNFAAFASWQKLVLVLLMWMGRLELFAVLALLQGSFWRR